MMTKTQKILAFGLSLCALNTFAQGPVTDSLAIDQIDIVKKYQYAVKKVKKLDTQPEFLDTNFITSKFNYELPLVGNRESKPIISPVKNSFFKLKSEAKKHLSYSNYIIGAFSSKANPFAEVSLAQELDNFKFGLFGQYHADNQTSNTKPFFGYEHARINGYFDYLHKKLLFQSEVGFRSQEENLVIQDGTRYTHQNISYGAYNAKVSVENLSTRSFLKDIVLEFNGLNEKNNNTETKVHFGASFSDYLYKESLLWRVNADYHLAVNEMDSNQLDNTIGFLDLSPQIQGDIDKFYYTAGLNYLYATDDNHLSKDGVSYFIPEVSLTYRFNKSYNITAGFQSDYEIYDYINIQGKNPYLTEAGVDTRTRVSKQVYANLDGKVSGIKYNLSGQYSIGGDRLFYQTLPIGKHYYSTYFEKGDYYSLNLNLDYQYTKNIGFNLNALAQQYKLEHDSKANHTPGFIMHFKTNYRVNERLMTYGTLKFATEQYMYSNTHFTDASVRNVQKTIDATLDISLGAHYDIRRQWRVFAEVNNILNQNYEIWGSYLHKGIYITGGFRFKF